MSGRIPGHRRPAAVSKDMHALEEIRRHLGWRLNTATHADTPALALRILQVTKDLDALRRRERQQAAETAERRRAAATGRLVERLMGALRAELKAQGEICGEDMLRETALEMVDDGSAAGFLASARAQARGPRDGSRRPAP